MDWAFHNSVCCSDLSDSGTTIWSVLHHGSVFDRCAHFYSKWVHRHADCG